MLIRQLSVHTSVDMVYFSAVDGYVTLGSIRVINFGGGYILLSMEDIYLLKGSILSNDPLDWT